jgi:hypothetical protein
MVVVFGVRRLAQLAHDALAHDDDHLVVFER